MNSNLVEYNFLFKSMIFGLKFLLAPKLSFYSVFVLLLHNDFVSVLSYR